MINQVYVGLGGNLGDPAQSLSQALEHIRSLSTISDFRSSHFYRTTPVELADQNAREFINAACTFKTTLNPKELKAELENIEHLLGKSPKKRHESRMIDLDLLFFGERTYRDEQLVIPHPRWKERLFVLIPLADLTAEIIVKNDSGKEIYYDLPYMLQTFENRHQESVIRI